MEQWDSEAVRARVAAILGSEEFAQECEAFDRTKVIKQSDGAGPPMHLIHSERLAELGRIPHHDEGETIRASQIPGIAKVNEVEIFMVSHRWLRPSSDHSRSRPDTEENRKARAINEFSRWRRKWIESQPNGFSPEIYYWIDYCCIDRRDFGASVEMLPLWTACCERMLRVEPATGNDYDERAWCRLEPLLAYTFGFAHHQTIIDTDFKFRWPCKGNQEYLPLPDPSEGQLTDQADRRWIADLTRISLAARPARGRGRVELGMTIPPSGSAVECFRMPSPSA